MELGILRAHPVHAVATLASAVACTALPATATSRPAVTPTPPSRQVVLTPALEEGQRLFVQVGCAGCHGSQAEFLIMVNMPELSEAAVKAQVRKPTGMMAAFSEAALNDGDLDRIARFVVAVLSQR